jgi:hypothetical protein
VSVRGYFEIGIALRAERGLFYTVPSVILLGMHESVCLCNGTVITGFAMMEDCSVLVEDGRIADVFPGGGLSKNTLVPAQKS